MKIGVSYFIALLFAVLLFGYLTYRGATNQLSYWDSICASSIQKDSATCLKQHVFDKTGSIWLSAAGDACYYVLPIFVAIIVIVYLASYLKAKYVI